MDWTKFRQHVAWRRRVNPALVEAQVSWLESEGLRFGEPLSEPLERRKFSAEDIIRAVRETAERERLEKKVKNGV